MKIGVIILYILAMTIVFVVSFKSGHFIKNLFKYAFQGIISMFAVNVLGLLSGVSIAINWYTLTTAAIFGMPSVISLVLLDTFLK